jgi:CxxC-x17-CxxC domain-containing protein
MKNFNNNNKFGRDQSGQNFRRRDSNRSRFGSQNSGHTQMHDAVCADCGDNCKVPFMPTSGKPVYCSNCFEKKGKGDNRSRRPSFSNRSNFSAPSNRPQKNYNKQFEIINEKLDKILKALAPKEEQLNIEEVENKEVVVIKPTEEKIEVKKTKKKKAKVKKAIKPEIVTAETEVVVEKTST